MSVKSMLGSVFLLTLLCIAGCMFMIRGCLSQYDERTALPGVLYFENDTSKLLAAIVRYDKATSYEQRGGFTSKSVNTTYYLESNDGITGAKRREQKIKDHEDVKDFPVRMIGVGGGLVWLFAGELLAYDPVTLENKANVTVLESKNPLLRGMFPKQGQYYRYVAADGSIAITATDGTRWKLNTRTLLLNAAGDDDKDVYEQAIGGVEEQLKKTEARIDSLHQYNGGAPDHLYTHIQKWYAVRDSLNREIHKLQSQQQAATSREREIENLGNFNAAFASIKTNSDTIAGQFYGLFSQKEMKDLADVYYKRTEYDETARRQFYTSKMIDDRNGNTRIDKASAIISKPSLSFLHGGFLLDKTTALPIRIDNQFLIVHKTQIGNDGKIQVSKMDISSGVAWTVDTRLKEWIDYRLTPKRLYIFGSDNPELSSTEINALLIIDLQNGQVNRFDYFTDKSL